MKKLIIIIGVFLLVGCISRKETAERAKRLFPNAEIWQVDFEDSFKEDECFNCPASFIIKEGELYYYIRRYNDNVETYPVKKIQEKK